MKWSIGLPCYNNFTEVWFTVQALRLYHDLTDSEIIIIDNFGDLGLKDYVRQKGGQTVKYHCFNQVKGVSHAKNAVFSVAKGDYVLIMDSHILLKPGALDISINNDDLYQGPLLNASCDSYLTGWEPNWRRRMWGTWSKPIKELPDSPFEIWAQGAGFFACRRESFLGFNEDFRGFGAETGYIQEKYRRAGRRVWCHPKLVWQHYFCSGKCLGGRPIPYPLRMQDRVRNYLLAFQELGLSCEDIKNHFGIDEVYRAVNFGRENYGDDNLLSEYVGL